MLPFFCLQNKMNSSVQLGLTHGLQVESIAQWKNLEGDRLREEPSIVDLKTATAVPKKP
jgi:hypothetical protein